MRHTLVAALAALLTGCATGPQTASGRPEIEVVLDTQTARTRLVDAYSSAGANITSVDDMGVTIVQPLSGSEEFWFGRGQHQLRFNLIERRGTTTIRATAYMLSATTSTETSTGSAGAELQSALERIFADCMVAPMAAPPR